MNSLFTLGLMIGISVHDTTLGTTIANLGMTETTFPHPLFHGDTIHVETEVISMRDSKSRPDRGIVEFEHRAFNQKAELVAKCRRQAMIMKKKKAG
jgi:acyl dehydratase